MKGTITVMGNDIKLTLDPETEVERLVFREMGDEMSISRSHNSIVLRRRGPIVHSLVEDESLAEPLPALEETVEAAEDADMELEFVDEVSTA